MAQMMCLMNVCASMLPLGAEPKYLHSARLTPDPNTNACNAREYLVHLLPADFDVVPANA